MRSRDILPGLPPKSAERLRDGLDAMGDPDNIGACWPLTVVQDPGGKLQFGLDMTYEDFRPWKDMPVLDAQTNNLDIFQFNWLLFRLESQSTLTGMQRGGRGVKVWFTNTSNENLIIANLSTASDSHNKFTCPGGNDFVLGPGDQCYAVYDGEFWWVGCQESSDATYYVTNDPSFPAPGQTRFITINGVPVVVKKTGTMVMNTATRRLEIWDGSNWIEFCPCNEAESGMSGSGDAAGSGGIQTSCCDVEIPRTIYGSVYGQLGSCTCLPSLLTFEYEGEIFPSVFRWSCQLSSCRDVAAGFDTLYLTCAPTAFTFSGKLYLDAHNPTFSSCDFLGEPFLLTFDIIGDDGAALCSNTGDAGSFSIAFTT